MMAMIQWSDMMSVKVKEIDRQHQKLITMINDLYDAMKERKGKEVIEKIINELANYAATHFSTEEKYFHKYGYPEADAHKQEHDTFVNKVVEFKKGFESQKISLTTEVMTFMSDWLRNHIMKIDKQYTNFFNSSGLF